MERRDPELPPGEIVNRIKRALDIEGTHTWEDVVESLVRGESQIFWNGHGAWITRVEQAPQARQLVVWIVAGELPGVMDLHSSVEKHAFLMGCTQMIAKARFGWKHVAKEYGWEPQAMILSREIDLNA